jgi:hypothetical protein
MFKSVCTLRQNILYPRFNVILQYLPFLLRGTINAKTNLKHLGSLWLYLLEMLNSSVYFEYIFKNRLKS